MLSHSLRFETEPHFFLTGEGWGNPSNPPLILLHGGGQTRHSWGDTAQKLAKKAGMPSLMMRAVTGKVIGRPTATT